MNIEQANGNYKFLIGCEKMIRVTGETQKSEIAYAI